MNGPTNASGVAAAIQEAWNGKKKKPKDLTPQQLMNRPTKGV